MVTLLFIEHLCVPSITLAFLQKLFPLSLKVALRYWNQSPFSSQNIEAH